MAYIVIDKSWLQSSSAAHDLRKIAAKNRIVITDILMYEISTADNNSKKLSCFKKLLSSHHSLEFLPNTGALIRHELSSHSSGHTLEDKLYPSFLYPNFLVSLSKYADKTVKAGNVFNKLYYVHFENNDVEFLKKFGSCISYDFPEIRGIKPGEKTDIINKIKQTIGRDEEVVKSYYKKIYSLSDNVDANDFPPVELLSKNWALFRHVQVYLIAAIIFAGRYGYGNLHIQSKKLAHDCVDFEYLISGTLANGMATKDNLFKEIFSICCPDGTLYH
jgi:hypothetical protein